MCKYFPIFQWIFISGAFISGADAQISNRIGLEGGITIPFVSIHPDPTIESTSPILSPVFGAKIELPLSDRICVSSEILYSRIGIKEHSYRPFGPLDFPVDRYGEVDYLQVPLLFAFQLDECTMRPTFYFGPDLRIKVGFQDKVEIGYHTYPDFLDHYEPWDLSIDAGTGIDVPVSKTLACELSLRYTFGIRNDEAVENFPWRSRSIQILAGMVCSLPN
jgi:hypothetical protein